MQREGQVIIEVDNEATVVNRQAGALVMVVDSSGKDVTGLLKHWLDIAQVVEMKANCKELTSGDLLHFELENAHLYVIPNSDIQTSLTKVLDLAESHDVTSINMPDIQEVSTIVWGMNHPSNILLRLCRA